MDSSRWRIRAVIFFYPHFGEALSDVVRINGVSRSGRLLLYFSRVRQGPFTLAANPSFFKRGDCRVAAQI